MNSAQPNPLPPWWSLSIAPYLWIGAVLLIAAAYAFPQTDDFCTFARLYFNSSDNPFRETWYLYQNWTGRYSASFVVAAVGWLASVTPLPLQWVYAASLMAFLALLYFACIRASQLIHDYRSVNVPLTSIIFATMIVLMPSKLEGLLWLTGVAVYSFGLVLLPLLFHSVLRDDDAGRNYSYLSLSFIAIAVGFNEFIGLAVGAFLAFRALLKFREPRWIQRDAAYFVTYAITFTLTIVAPGNFARDATISAQRHNLPAAVELSMQSADLFVETHILPYWGTLLGVTVAAVAAGWLARAPRRNLANLIPAATALIVSFPAHFLVYSFLTGEQVPGRVINQAYAMALMGYLLACAWAGARIAERRPWPVRWPAAAIIAAVGVFLVASPPVRNVATTTRDFGPIWKSQQSQRHKELLSAGRGAAAVVPSFTRESSNSPVLQGADLTQDTGYWVNTCTADFYRLGTIAVKPR